MKALVTTLAFGGAVGLTALTIAIQQNPFTFTTHSGAPVGQFLDVPVQIVPVSVPVAADEPVIAASNVVTIEEVRVEGRVTRQWRAAAPAEPEVVVPELVAAPCVQGEYRKLDEHRGVYLMCPE